MSHFLKNYLSTIIIILATFFIYNEIPYYQNYLSKIYSLKFNHFTLTTIEIYKAIVISYIVLLIPFYIFLKEKSKARIAYGYIRNKIKDFKYKMKKEEQVSFLAWGVKIFFAPLMIMWLTDHIFTMLNNIYFSYNDIGILSYSFLVFFNKHFFWLFFSIILFADVLLFTIGYLIESPKLKNKIKSVDATILGWFVVLMCYPPFNAYTGGYLGWYSRDFPQFTNEYIHIGLNIIILVLMGIFSWASISLGFKASNLTNRGIVSKGPYSIIRHPAYISKNIAWWIGGLPLLIGNFSSGQVKHFFIVLGSLMAWTFIYYLRAITEERHLSQDKDYIEYKKKVKYKFIPKIY